MNKAIGCAIITTIISLSSFDAFSASENPFKKPSQRAGYVDQTEVVETCDMEKIQILVNEKLAELIPTKPDIVEASVDVNDMDALVAFYESQEFRFVGDMNGTKVYFDDKNGVFKYAKNNNGEAK